MKAIIVSLLGRLINFAGRNSESVHEAISSVAGRESASVDYFAMFFNRLQTLFEGQVCGFAFCQQRRNFKKLIFDFFFPFFF